MNWINIHTDILRSEAYLGAEPVERATWLNLIAWCCTQENGGMIKGAGEWGDRKWQQLCGVTKEETRLVSDLYHFTDAGDLIVNLYPIEKEAEVKVNREIGAKGGSRKSAAKSKAARENGANGGRPAKPHSLSAEHNPSGNPSETQAETQRKEKGKGKRRVKKGESGETHPHPQASPDGKGIVPFRTAPDKPEIIARLNSCHPAWTSPELDGKEIKPFAESFAYLREIPANHWPVIGEFLGTRKEAGSAAWRPKNRLQLIDNIAEVHGYAIDWKRKQRPATAKPAPAPEPEGEPATAEDIAALFADIFPRKSGT